MTMMLLLMTQLMLLNKTHALIAWGVKGKHQTQDNTTHINSIKGS